MSGPKAGQIYKEFTCTLLVTVAQCWSVSCSLTPFFTGGPPYDGTARNRTRTTLLGLVSIYSIAAIAGMLYAVVCLLFNIVFRNKRYPHRFCISVQAVQSLLVLFLLTSRVVKLSSRNLNYLIVAGAAVLYASVFLYIFSDRTPHDVLCNVWKLIVGTVLFF